MKAARNLALRRVLPSHGQSAADHGQKTKRSCRTRFLDAFSNENSFVRRIITTVLLVIYSFVGSAVFYAIANNTTGCQLDFWACLYYVNTIYLSIGYGMILPCSDAAKVFTILYTTIGLPLALATLDDTGAILETWTGICWSKIHRRYRRTFGHGVKSIKHINVKRTTKKIQPTVRKSQAFVPAAAAVTLQKYATKARIAKLKYNRHLPVPVAFFLTLLWLLLASAFFYGTAIEDSNWSFFEAFYFLLTSAATIGLGDYDVISATLNGSTVKTFCDSCSLGEDVGIQSGGVRVVGNFFIIIIAISMFSMSIKIVQQRLESMTDIVGASIIVEYVALLRQGHHLTLDVDEDAAEAEAQQRDTINKLIRKRARHVSFLIQKTLEQRMMAEYKRLVNVRLAATQTVSQVELCDSEVTACPETTDAEVQTDMEPCGSDDSWSAGLGSSLDTLSVPELDEEVETDRPPEDGSGDSAELRDNDS